MLQKKRNSEVAPVSFGRDQRPRYYELVGLYFQRPDDEVDYFLVLHFRELPNHALSGRKYILVLALRKNNHVLSSFWTLN